MELKCHSWYLSSQLQPDNTSTSGFKWAHRKVHSLSLCRQHRTLPISTGKKKKNKILFGKLLIIKSEVCPVTPSEPKPCSSAYSSWQQHQWILYYVLGRVSKASIHCWKLFCCKNFVYNNRYVLSCGFPQMWEGFTQFIFWFPKPLKGPLLGLTAAGLT